MRKCPMARELFPPTGNAEEQQSAINFLQNSLMTSNLFACAFAPLIARVSNGTIDSSDIRRLLITPKRDGQLDYRCSRR